MKHIHFETIDSTSKYIAREYLSLDNFTFVSCDEQTAGRGRNDRKWYSEPKENLLFSILIKEKSLLDNFNYLSLLTAKEIACALEEMGLKEVSIKWPNDVYVQDKKIAGILLLGDVNKYLSIGVGLNVNQTVFNDEYRIQPTSIKLETNQQTDIENFSETLFSKLESSIKSFNKVSLLNYANSHNYLYNKFSETFNGTFKEINDDCSLKIELNNGETKSLISGEINLD